MAIIDGEHHAPVVRDALETLPHEVVAAWLAGGREKLRGGEDYGVPLAAGLEEGVAEYGPDLVVDLSDEPVLGPPERLRVASRVLALDLPYVGPDFRFDPPSAPPVDVPALAVIGTGKRVGKTAVTAHAARLLAADRAVVVVAMGRGGPPKPELLERSPSLNELLSRSRAGLHAASDYLEIAALTGVPTVGCRRCGGGLAGSPAVSNVAAGVELAAERRPDLVLLDGSGAALPPVKADARVLVIGADQGPLLATGYLNAYRILVADLVVLTMCEQGTPYEAVRSAVAELSPVPVVATVLRPRPTARVAGRRVGFFTVAPAAAHATLAEHVRAEHGAAEVVVSGHLADRAALKRDLAGLDADVFLVELKAAAVDVVLEAAVARGIEVVLADAEVRALPGELDLDGRLCALADAAARRSLP
ncbi:MAG: 2,3-diphosphoglycerate synthetase [Gaiellaceae bacterium]